LIGEYERTNMKAIETKYIRPTNTRGARVKASDHCGNSIILPWYETAAEMNHWCAAIALCTKMNWPKKLISGYLNNNMVHIILEDK
jgi:hypothetical protein